MIISLHDSNLSRVCYIDNNLPDVMHYSDDSWNRYLQEATSTFDFKVYKTGNKYEYFLNEKNYVSFSYGNSQYLFSIMRTEEDESSIKIYAENLNLELLNETKQPIDITTSSTLLWYLNANYLIEGSGITIGINEVSDQTRKIKLESEQTGLARLISIANNFGAEIEFVTSLNTDGTLNSLVANFYKKYDGINYQGVGRDRQDVILEYGKNIESITRTVDKTDIFNTIVPVGKDDVGIESIEQTEYDDKGNIEFYTKAGSKSIYAPISKQLYRGQLANGNDGWIQRYHTLDGTSDARTLYTLGLNELRKHAYPAVTYDVKGFFDLNIGDTVRVFDSGFSPILLLKARVAQQTISFSNPSQNKTTFGNIQALENRLSKDITSRLAQLVEEATPYRFEIISSDGLTFKNSTGQTTLTARVYKGAKVDEVSVDKFDWTINGTKFGGTGKNQLIKASDISGTAVVRYNATIGGAVVGGLEVTIQDVSDGAAGRGIKDKSSKWQLTTTTAQPTDAWSSTKWNGTLQIATTTNKYLWQIDRTTYTDDTTSDLITLSAVYGDTGATGATGQNGTITHTAYANSADGTDGFTTVYPNLNLFNNSKYNYYASTETGNNNSSNTYSLAVSQLSILNQPISIYYDYLISKSTGTWSGVIRPTYGFGGTNQPVSSSNLSGSHSEVITLSSLNSTSFGILLSGLPSGTVVSIRNLKVELANAPTPWMPSSSEVTTADWPKYRGEYSDISSEQSTNPSDYTWSLMRGNDGKDALNLTLSNQAVTIPATYDGSVQSYSGTGTRIDLTEGTTVLQYDGAGVTAGTWKVSATATGITCGAIVDSGAYATIANHSEMTIDSATIEYTITGKRTNGANFTIKASQSFSKSKQGIVGVSSYTWIRYSANSNGASMTTQPGADTKYIGLYTGASATPPTNNIDYTWSNHVGPKGDPTGVTKQATEPVSAQRFLGMIWQYTGTASMTITGTTATPNAMYRWTGTSWELWYFYAANIQADAAFFNLLNVSSATVDNLGVNGAINANLINPTAGNMLTNSEFQSNGFFDGWKFSGTLSSYFSNTNSFYQSSNGDSSSVVTFDSRSASADNSVFGMMFQDIRASAGLSYSFSGVGIVTAGTGFLRFRIYAINENGATIGSSTAVDYSTNSWTTLKSENYVAPTGTAYIRYAVVGFGQVRLGATRVMLNKGTKVAPYTPSAGALTVTGDMVVDGAIKAQKLSVNTLSTISSDIGTMIAGIIKVMADIIINAAGNTKKFGMLFTKKGLLSTGPTFDAAGQASDTKMAVASLTQGELRFINMDYNENLEQVQDSGTSSANNGFIRFSSTAEKGDLLEISSGGSILLDGFTTQTNAWIKLTELSYYKVMFGRVNIRVCLTSGSLRDNIYLGTVPDQYKSPNGEQMLPAQAWSINTNLDRHVQYSTNGSLYLLNPEPNTKYVFEVSYTL